jgi:hypothetical protein
MNTQEYQPYQQPQGLLHQPCYQPLATNVNSLDILCNWIIQKSDEKLSRIGIIRSKSKPESYSFLIRRVKKMAIAELIAINSGKLGFN